MMTYPCHRFCEQVGLAGDLRSTNGILIPLVEMDDANLTMEEYIEFEAETARRRGQIYNDEDYTFIYDKNSFSCKLVPVDLQTDLENDNIKVNVSSGDIFIKQSENGIDANVDTQSYGYDKDFETNHDIHSEPFNRKNYIIM
ncbi:hypothetical protein Tco_1489197, partial [Tanacetum coccineum]